MRHHKSSLLSILDKAQKTEELTTCMIIFLSPIQAIPLWEMHGWYLMSTNDHLLDQFR